MATIIDGNKRIPFMRGMLVHHLIQRGFNHEEAIEVAQSVRDVLNKQKEIARKDIVAVIDDVLKAQYPGRPVADLVFWEQSPTSITVERKSGPRPFSKELLSHSIQASGLPPDGAYRIAQELERSLIDQRRSVVTHRELEELVLHTLAERHDQAYADRYRVWRTWADLDKPLIILIGGASGVGKTSLAVSLAHVLDIPRVVATDDIRQIMRLTLAPEFMPAIHTSSYMVWSEVGVPEGTQLDPVVAGFREQGRIIAVGVQAILSRSIEENASVIIDGVHLLPSHVDLEPFQQEAFIVPLCLALADKEAYAERFAKRASEAPARPVHRYLSHLEDILKVQSDIVDWSYAHDIPVIDPNSVDDVTSAAVMVVVERLQEEAEFTKITGSNGGVKKKKGKGRASE